MPQRFLRPGIRTSPRWNSVSHEAHTLYIAILTLVDDYGRYDGRASVLWAESFAVWNEQNPQSAVSPQQTAALCQQLADNKLVHFYEVGGRQYLQLFQWQERARSISHWPPPPQDFDSNPLRNPAESCGILPPSPSPSPSPHVASSGVEEDDRDSESGLSFVEFVEHWNGIEGIAHCEAQTLKRKKAFKARMHDDFFREHWERAIEKLAESDFCKGNGERGWKADIDWFLKPDSCARIIEGKYDTPVQAPKFRL